MAVVSWRLLADSIAQFLHALVPWRFTALFEVVSEKVETFPFLLCIHDSGLLRMQLQAGFRRPSLHFLQRSVGFLVVRSAICEG